jgi:hypothetical protein
LRELYCERAESLEEAIAFAAPRKRQWCFPNFFDRGWSGACGVSRGGSWDANLLGSDASVVPEHAEKKSGRVDYGRVVIDDIVRMS